MILYHYNDAWYLAKISVSRLSEQGKLRINFVNDTVWSDVELRVDDHGPDEKQGYSLEKLFNNCTYNDVYIQCMYQKLYSHNSIENLL